MPLMLMNLRADGGLASHREYLKDEVETWLVDKQEEADVTFICSSVDSDNDDTVMLAAHQAVLAPVSSVLRDMFNEHSCALVRNMIYISVDCDPQVLQSILCLIYNGKTYLSTTAVERMKAIVKMLDLKFPGGFDRSILARGSVPPTNNVFQIKNRPKESGIKRPHEPTRVGSSDSPSPSAKKSRPSPSPSTREEPAKTRVNATERMNIHVAMTLELKDAAPGTSVKCKMPGCESMVSYDQLANHFLGHENSANGDPSSQASVPCVACGLTFKTKKDLDHHTKTKHGSGAIISMKERLNLLSDSSDEDDSFDRVSETATVKEPTQKAKPKCNKCDSVFASVLHLKSHTCNANNANTESNKCDTCFKTFKTNKAVREHMKTAHKSSPAGSKMTSIIKKENESPSKRYSCQICTKRFLEFRQLRTHYTLYHVWDELAEEYKDWNDTCKICQKQYPTEDHLLQHMGNFHCKIDQVLIQKGLRIISQEKTIKLMSFTCNICKVTQTSSAALKSHMSVKHYQKELLAEFPIHRGKVKKCPKCFKLFDQSSVGTVVAHIGSFHDEVIKYAIEHLELEAADIEHVPVDDFDDGTIGTPVSLELNFSCQKCDKKLKNKMELKLHYVQIHFQFKFGVTCLDNICKFCPDPGKQFPASNLLCKHLVVKHDEEVWSILKQEGVTVPTSPRKPANSSKDVFEYLVCQICFQEFHSSNSLKIHYIRHFQTNFQTQYFSRTCPHCDREPFPDIFGSQKHIATEHADKSIIPFMESHGLWVNKSVILPPSAAKLKRIGINVKKLDRRSIQSHLTELEEEKSSSVNVKHTCVMPGCEKEYETRDHFLTHLVINHFWKDISVEYGDSFNTDPKTCPVCKEMFNINSERMAYYKHLAVNHEVVMKYVDNSKNKAKEGRTTIKLVNRMAPPALSSSSPSSAPVLRFSNESSDDSTAGLPSNSSMTTVVKTEAVEDKSMTRNEELVSKIRNVFSDDSDSD